MNLITMKKSAAVMFALLLMATAALPSPAKAQSISELQAQINVLLAQIAVLQAQLGGASGQCTATFTRNLSVGMSGPDVLALQKFLNKSADTQVSVSGAGAPGLETQYYGPATAAAVSKFQVKYRAQVLTPSGLVNPTGFFGPSSRAKANALCTVVVPPVVNPGDDDDDDDDGGALKGGEARLDSFKADDGDDTSIAEGQDNAPVMDVEFDVKDGDVQINRIDVAFDHVSGGDDDPWDVFEEVSIWVDGDEVASMDTDNRRVWSEDQPNSGDYRLRFTSIDDFIVREGKTAEFTVAVTVARNVDDAGSVEWETFIPDDGIRAIDSEKINHFIGETDETVSFTVNEAGEGADLVVRTSDEDPDATVLPLKRSATSNWMTVFAFELDADDSEDDLTIKSLPLTVDVSDSETYNALVRNARLVIDGERYDDVEVSNGGTDTAELTFDLDDLTIDAGEAVTVELELEFRALPEADEGTRLQASITSAQADAIDAEGRDDLSASQISGSAMGELHTLQTGGTSSSNPQTSAVVTSVNGSNNDYVTFTVEFDVRAFEQDAYIPIDPSTSLTYRVEDTSGNDLSGTGTVNAVLDSDAREEGQFYVVREGQTKTFELRVVYVPGVSNTAARLQLLTLKYDSEADLTPDQTWTAAPLSSYRTPTRIIVD